MIVIATEIPDVKIVRTARHSDDRGFFSETYRRDRALADLGVDFVQDNHSLSRHVGTVRGLHFQRVPHAQAKLVRVVRGAIFDVAVDLRRDSVTYRQHVAVMITADDWSQILVPIGFAHGFCTITADTEVVYKTSDYYAPEYDGGIAFDDPELAIPWPVDRAAAVLSSKDAALPRLAEIDPPF